MLHMNFDYFKDFASKHKFPIDDEVIDNILSQSYCGMDPYMFTNLYISKYEDTFHNEELNNKATELEREHHHH